MTSDEFDTMTAREMMARRAAAEQEIARLIGLFLFAYSRFVTAVHLAVAWFDHGAALDEHAERAGALSVGHLLKCIRERAQDRIPEKSKGWVSYIQWCDRANALRAARNDIAHARWGIEAYGRYAIAVTTPVLVEPAKQREFTAAQLQALSKECSELVEELSALRKAFPL